ncbi:MAG: hypothetical protein QOF76_5567 [Solirubrobacteraceae bacterium]|jgi:uncharacterized cupin superfamily protein|nr:hypothetical protein [Solirubrobacteraceae bacterium]
MRRFNFNTAPVETDADDPPGYHCGAAGIGAAIGGETIAGNLFVLPPGEAVCPYHWETDEEWLLVISGDVVVRHAEGEDTLGPGDIVCFPAGPPGAHKVSAGATEARCMILSTRNFPAVAGYPDSDKIGVWTGPAQREGMFPKSSSVDYYEGET